MVQQFPFIQNLFTELKSKLMATFDLEKKAPYLFDISNCMGSFSEEAKANKSSQVPRKVNTNFLGMQSLAKWEILRTHGHGRCQRSHPVGHWIGINRDKPQSRKSLFFSYFFFANSLWALVGLTLHDAFISCWKPNLRKRSVRPERF